MHITLRPNEKIYINGAVLRVDRKVSLELMNDAVFLLEAHVMLERNATTPLRRLYFIVQLMLIEPSELESKKIMFNLQGITVAGAYQDDAIQAGLAAVTELVKRGRTFEALKVIRNMIPLEDELIARAGGVPASPIAAPAAVPSPPERSAVAAKPQRRVTDLPAGRLPARHAMPVA